VGIGFQQGCGRGADDGDISVVPGEGGADDGVQRNAEKMEAWSRYSISSCRGGKWWIEELQAPLGFGHGWSHRFAMKIGREKLAEGANKNGKGHGPKMGGAGSPSRWNRLGFGRGRGELR
jgi:hypothetical protein